MMTRLRLTDEEERARAALACSDGDGELEAAWGVSLEAADQPAQISVVAELSACGRERYGALLDRLAQ